MVALGREVVVEGIRGGGGVTAQSSVCECLHMLVGTTHRLPAAVYPNIRVCGEPREQVNLVSGVHFDFRLEEFCPTYPGMACYQIALSRRKRLALDNTMQACLYNEYKATADRAHSFQQLYEAGLKS